MDHVCKIIQYLEIMSCCNALRHVDVLRLFLLLVLLKVSFFQMRGFFSSAVLVLGQALGFSKAPRDCWVNFSSENCTEGASGYKDGQNVVSYTVWEVSAGCSQCWPFFLFWGGNFPFPKIGRSKKVDLEMTTIVYFEDLFQRLCAHLYQFIRDLYIFSSLVECSAWSIPSSCRDSFTC